MASKPKFLFVTGGVVSSLGKGILSASLGSLLESKKIKVTIMKLDPYINLDPGTMSPFQHGEVFVTEDGAETDLDLGHYERFLSINTSQKNNVTTGKIADDAVTSAKLGPGAVDTTAIGTNAVTRRLYTSSGGWGFREIRYGHWAACNGGFGGPRCGV